MSLQDACINRYQALSSRNQQRLSDHWDMFAALQLHQLLATGTLSERATAAAHTAAEVYDTMSAYFDDAIRQAAEDEPSVIGFELGHDLYNKLVYMAKHGLSIKEGDLP